MTQPLVLTGVFQVAQLFVRFLEDKLLHLWYVKGGPDEGSAGDDLVVLLGSVRFDVPFKSFSINILTPDCFTTLDSL